MKDIVLYSTQPVLAAGLDIILKNTGINRVATTCAEIRDVAAAVTASNAGLIMIDLTPEVTIDGITRLCAECPDIAVILWFDRISTEFAAQAVNAGVRGVLRKTMPVEMLLECLADVVAGELSVDKAVGDQLIRNRRVNLTRRERELMGLIAHGLRNKEVAWRMGLSEGTVKIYVSRLLSKVGVSDRLELALLALRNVTDAGSFRTSPTPPPMLMPSFLSRAA